MAMTGSTATLRAALKGNLVLPGEAEYEAARHVYNAMIDKHPALVIRCADEDDVVQGLGIARDRGLLAAVRGGGHSGGGFGTCDGGVVIDLGALRTVDVDPDSRTVRAGGGATWGDMDRATHAHGLAIPCGIISTTGVGGLTLGGGHGYLTRKYGLSVDNLIGAEVLRVNQNIEVRG